MRIVILLPFIFVMGCAQAVFHVNTTQDLRNENPGDGQCRSVGNPNLCSLRAAIEEADAGNPGTNYQIHIPAGTYLITDLPDVPNPARGLEMSNTTVMIHGAGANVTEIRPEFSARHFTVTGGALQITGLALRGGLATSTQSGGSIHAAGAVVVLDGMIIEDNESDFRGGGIYAIGVSPPAHLSIANSVIGNNATAVGAQGGGGGIFSNVPVELGNVQVQGNRGGVGGGMWLSSNGPNSIHASAFVGNEAHTAGGLRISTNELAISQSTFSGNTACHRVAGINVVSGDVTIGSSTIVSNRTETAGFSSFCGTLTDGAGIQTSANASAVLTNTVLAGNTVAELPSDCEGDVLSGGFNLIGTVEGCDFDAATSDTVGSGADVLNPGLGPLTSIGSPTSYHLPDLNSPAVDTGAACGAADQRGQPRPADGNGDGSVQCDRGSIERQ